MATPCVLKSGITNNGKPNELTTNNYSKKPPSIEKHTPCQSLKSSKCSISIISSKNAPINCEKGNNKHTKVTNDGNNENKIKIKKRNERKEKNAKNDPIKVQNNFSNAMTKAIIRFLDKNPEINKTKAEKSVFIALGYDISIENDQDEMYNKSFLNDIKHYRCHHIMRDHDAIRTFRIKQLYNMITKQYPSYGDEQILEYLTRKLNQLYLPSPSPPPPPPPPSIAKNKNENDKDHKVKNEQKTNQSNINKVNENESDLSQNTVDIQPSIVVKPKHFKKISRKAAETKNVNCSINEAQHNNVTKNVSVISNDDDNKNNNINTNNQCIANHKSKKITTTITATTTNNDNVNNKSEHKRDLSPSQIYITVNDTFSNKLLSESSLKYQKTFNDNETEIISTKSIINKQGIGFKQQTITNNNFIHSNSKTKKNNNMLLKSLVFQPNKTTKYNYFNEEDEVLQKLKKHKKSRKRKFVQTIPNEFEMNNFDKQQITQQPPKKRSRYGNKSRQRSKNNKSRGSGGGRGGVRDRKSNRNKYGTNLRRSSNNCTTTTTNNDNNHSTDCFDDEEDDGSDIDLNANSNNLRRPQAQHL